MRTFLEWAHSNDLLIESGSSGHKIVQVAKIDKDQDGELVMWFMTAGPDGKGQGPINGPTSPLVKMSSAAAAGTQFPPTNDMNKAWVAIQTNSGSVYYALMDIQMANSFSKIINTLAGARHQLGDPAKAARKMGQQTPSTPQPSSPPAGGVRSPRPGGSVV